MHVGLTYRLSASVMQNHVYDYVQVVLLAIES